MKLKFICEHSGINFSNVNMTEPEVQAVEQNENPKAPIGGYDFATKQNIQASAVEAGRPVTK